MIFILRSRAAAEEIGYSAIKVTQFALMPVLSYAYPPAGQHKNLTNSLGPLSPNGLWREKSPEGHPPLPCNQVFDLPIFPGGHPGAHFCPPP